jgi:plasmid stability protein
MATLTIRNLPQDVYDRLRARAAANRRSMEAEAREVIAKSIPPKLTPEQALHNLQEMMKNVKPKHGDSLVDEFLAERRAMWGEDE